MRMQEPEQERQAGQEYSGYRADYSGNYQPDQQQKIYTTEERRLYSKALWIFSVVLSSIGFFLTVAGV